VILGFAHLSVNVDDLDLAETEWLGRGYVRQAVFRKIPNPPGKQLYRDPHPAVHDLMLLGGEGLWPIELTCHGVTAGKNSVLHWTREVIEIYCADPVAAAKFLVAGLGFRQMENGWLVSESLVKGWSCRLEIKKADVPPASLNASGATCLAFYCTRPNIDAEVLMKLGASDYTGVFDLKVGDRDMSIAMLRTPFGILLELINPRTRH